MRKIIVLLTLTGVLSSCHALKKSYKPIILSGQILSEVSGSDWVELPNIRISPSEEIKIEIDSIGKYRVENLKPNQEYKFEIRGWVYHIVEKTLRLEESTKMDFTLKTDDRHPYDGINALNDIENRNTRFFISSGIVGIANGPSDNEFEKDYKIQYHDFGCVSPSEETIRKYNSQIATYLDRTFGIEWREKVRRDVKYIK